MIFKENHIVTSLDDERACIVKGIGMDDVFLLTELVGDLLNESLPSGMKPGFENNWVITNLINEEVIIDDEMGLEDELQHVEDDGELLS